MFYCILLWLFHVILELGFIIKEKCEQMLCLATYMCTNSTFKGRGRLQVCHVPSHVSFVIVENDISISDVVNLIIWSAAAGIPYISFYDRAGVIKKKKKDLENLFISKIQSKELAKLVVNFESDNEVTLNSKNGTNGGCIKDKRLHISLLSSDDGRQDIVNAAKYLCKATECDSVTVQQIMPKNFSAYLTAANGFPDPELVIRFGKTESLLGFLPWQIRLSEILSVSTHKNIVLENFINLLQRFGKCERRWGK